MDRQDVDYIVAELVPAVSQYVAEAVQKSANPLITQIAALESKIAEVETREPIKGDPGSSVTLDDVRPFLEDAVAALPKPQDGKSVTAEDVKPLLEEMVAAIPKPQDGKDAAPLELQQVVEAIKSFDVEQLVADTIAGEYGIDVVAPDGVAKEMAAAVALLAQPLVRKETPVAVQQSARPRKMTFERDEQNRIVAAIEE